jgi:16S rRNA (guanine527-N7)-methyltransferase
MGSMPRPPAASARVLEDLRVLGQRFGRELDEAALQGLARYVDLLHTWNARINLTGARSPEEIVGEQLPDSFALAQLVPPAAHLVDVGSGGGLPAVPFAVLRPDVQLTLIEPRSRRRAFLSTAVRELGLQAGVREGRAEDVAEERFGAATARAVFPPDEWLQQGGRMVVPGGLVFLFLGEAPWEPPAGWAAASELQYAVGRGRHRLLAVTSD